MARASKSGSLKTIATQRADDYKWGIPSRRSFRRCNCLCMNFRRMKATKPIFDLQGGS